MLFVVIREIILKVIRKSNCLRYIIDQDLMVSCIPDQLVDGYFCLYMGNDDLREFNLIFFFRNIVGLASITGQCGKDNG